MLETLQNRPEMVTPTGRGEYSPENGGSQAADGYHPQSLQFSYMWGMAEFDGATLGDRIFQLRQHLGSVRRLLSREDLAAELARLGVTYTPSSLARAERNEVEPPLSVAAAMARLARVSFEAFALGQPAPDADEAIDDDSMSPAEMEEHLQREGVIPSAPRRRKHRPA